MNGKSNGRTSGEANEPKRRAYHEAGHAVFACFVGLTIKSVTIESAIVDGVETDGLTAFVAPDSWPCLAQAMIVAAGDLAEAREMGEADRDARLWHRARIRDLLRHGRYIGERDGPDELTADEKQRVATLLETRWPAVIGVAAALMERTTLAGHAVCELVSGHCPIAKP